MPRITATSKVLYLLCALGFLLYLVRVNLSTAAGPMQAQLHLTNGQIGIAFSAFAYSYLGTQVLGGWVADRFGPRLTLIICVIIWIATTMATGLVTGIVSLFAVRFLLGCGEGPTLPAMARVIANWIPVDRRGFVQGITHSCSRLGNAVAPTLIAFVMTTTTWRQSFFYGGLITSVWLLLWWIYFVDDPKDHPAITAEELVRLPEHGKIRLSKTGTVPWGRILSRFAPSIAVYFCYGWTAWLYFTWMPLFFLHSYHVDIKKSAIFSTEVFFAGVVGDALGGICSDWIYKKTESLRIARSIFITTAFLLSALSLLPVVFSHQTSTVTISLGAAFFFIELSLAPIWLIPTDISPAHAGTAGGLINAGSAVAGIVSPMLFGFVIDRTGQWTAPFVGSIVLLVLGAVLAQFIHPERPMHEATAA